LFRIQDRGMLDNIMWLGIGFLTACLLMSLLAPLIHERAVRLTVRRLAYKRPRSVIDRRAHEDQLRAQFAVSILRLETTIRETQVKAATQLCDAAKKSADVYRLKAELRKSNVRILRFQARELVRRSMMGTIIKVLVYLFARRQRRNEREQRDAGYQPRDARKAGLGTVSDWSLRL
jgi:hypothetical protein